MIVKFFSLYSNFSLLSSSAISADLTKSSIKINSSFECGFCAPIPRLIDSIPFSFNEFASLPPSEILGVGSIQLFLRL